MLKKILGKIISPFLYLIEDFFEQPLIMKAFIGATALCLLVMIGSFVDSLPVFLETLVATQES